MISSSVRMRVGLVLGIIIAAVGWKFFNRSSPPIRQRYSSNAEDRGSVELEGKEKFRLIDQFSNAHGLSNYHSRRSVFLISVTRTCLPADSRKIKKIIDSVVDEGSVALLIASHIGETAADYQKIQVPTLLDPLQIVARAYALKTAWDYVELDPRTGKLTERGKFRQFSEEESCEIALTKGERLNFTRDVLPGFTIACNGCHMKYEDLDYFDSMENIRQWSTMMLTTMRILRMPPGGFDPHLYPILEISSPEKLHNLVAWLDSGAKATSDDELALQEARRHASKFNNSKPNYRKSDLTFRAETERIPESGTAFWHTSKLAGPLAEDLYITGYRVTNNLRVFHHANVFVFDRPIQDSDFNVHIDGVPHPTISPAVPATIRWTRARVNGVLSPAKIFDERIIASISRSNGLMLLGGDLASFVPKGSYLYLVNHYNPNGREELNTSKIEFFKYKGTVPPRLVRRLSMGPDFFTIPPHSENFSVKSRLTVGEDITILSFAPHMHYRGKSVKVHIQIPGEERRLIFSIPFWQLKFERTAIFTEPLFLPAKSVIDVEMTYDNSIGNSSNPNPKLSISMGGSTYLNEMHVMRIYYVNDRYVRGGKI